METGTQQELSVGVALKPCIFNYSSARLFLLDSLEYKKKKNPQFSIRQWAKKMGLTSHTLLTLVLRGERPLRLSHASFLSKGLVLTKKEQLFFRTLILFESASSPEEKELSWLLLKAVADGSTT